MPVAVDTYVVGSDRVFLVHGGHGCRWLDMVAVHDYNWLVAV